MEAQTLDTGVPAMGWGSVYTLGWFLCNKDQGLKGKAVELYNQE